jgi:hypothetical protein
VILFLLGIRFVLLAALLVAALLVVWSARASVD